jgi:polysaccharide biosynthesis/export protein
MRVWLAFVFCMVAISGCAGRLRPENSARLVVTQDAALPAPDRTDLVAPDRPSLIGPFDTLSIEVFNVPELTREVQVDASGRIAMPLVGQLDVTGKTSNELAKVIDASLRGRYVRNPQVIVNLKGSVSQVVTVDGSVQEPGLYPVSNQMTLMRAIASAKGATEFASLGDVVILRTVNGQAMAGLYNLSAIRTGAYSDPVIYANDVVIVGDSPTRRLFKDVLTVAPLLVAPAVALIQR